MWIYPYSYNTHKSMNPLKQEDYRLWRTYKKFTQIGDFGKKTILGTAIRTIDYAATGEASDWMLNKRNVFAFSPELGYPSPGSQHFYPKIKEQKRAVREHFKTVKSFFKFHIPRLRFISSYVTSFLTTSRPSLLTKGFQLKSQQNWEYILDLFNESVGNLRNVFLKVKTGSLRPLRLKIALGRREDERLRARDKNYKKLKFKKKGLFVISQKINIRRRSFIHLSVTFPHPMNIFEIQLVRRGEILAKYKSPSRFKVGLTLLKV